MTAVHALGLTFTSAARFVNALAFAAIVVLAWALIRRHVASPIVVVGATAAVALSSALLSISATAFSEPLFIVTVLGSLLALDVASTSTRAVVWFAVGGLLAGASFTVRYVGAATVLSGVLVTLAVLRRAAVRVGARALLAFGVAAALSPAIWIAHAARSANPDLLGPRAAAHDSAVALAKEMVRVVASTLAPFKSSDLLRVPFVVSLLALGCWRSFRCGRDPRKAHRRPRRRHQCGRSACSSLCTSRSPSLRDRSPATPSTSGSCRPSTCRWRSSPRSPSSGFGR